MSQSFLIGQYIDTSTLVHRLDPRTKILGIFLIILGFIWLENLAQFVFATILVCLIIRISRIPLKTVLKGLKPLVLILAFTFSYNLLFTTGTVVWSWSFIQITMKGIENAVKFVWRIILLVLIASVLTYTTKPLTLAKGFESLLKPLARLNIPIEKLSLMLVITIRFIPTIQEELQRILLTQKARGFDMERLPFAKRLYSYVPIIVPLLFTTVQRADHLSEAIDARGYGDGKNRTSYYVLHYDKQDVATIVLAVCCVFILFVL